MPFVHLSQLSFTHRDAVTLFENVSGVFGEGWTGLVGANGAGKTTLLQLIAGELEPDSGSIDVAGSVAFCHQTVDARSPSIDALAQSWAPADYALRGRLGLEPDDLKRWSTLSPGERKRWQVGAALAAAPDVLLLDEPTNHIDDQTRDLVLAGILQFNGAGLIVSHDRRILNDVCVRTARVHNGSLRIWSGPYETARIEWEQEAAAVTDERQSMKREERRLRNLADRQQRTLQARERADRRGLRMADPKDHDARSMEANARRSAGASAGSQQAARTGARAKRVGDAADELWEDKQLGSSIFVGYEPPGRRVLLSYEGPVRAGTHMVLGHVEASLHRDARIWLRGRNGAGKTSLLHALIDGSALPDAKVLWLPQDQTDDEREQLVHIVNALDRDVRGRVLNVLAVLGVDPTRFLASQLPSPGEARKLTLALGLGQQAWCLVLDEPTNHLDLPSIERLEVALAAYPGALLLVSHDEQFARALTDQVWNVEGGELRVG